MSKPNVYQRIHAVMNEIETLAKTGYNKFHKYNYVTEADYVRALRPLLDKHGLVIIPEILPETVNVKVSNDGDNLTTAVVKYTIVNIDDPSDRVQTSILAQGYDSTDKAAYKLLTGSKKYFAALTFMVATGDDPEKDEPERRQVLSKAKVGRKKMEDDRDDF